MVCILAVEFICIIVFLLSPQGDGDSKIPPTEPPKAETSWYEHLFPHRPAKATEPPSSQLAWSSFTTSYTFYLPGDVGSANDVADAGTFLRRTDDVNRNRSQEEEATATPEGTRGNTGDDTDMVVTLHGTPAKLVRTACRAVHRLVHKVRRLAHKVADWLKLTLVQEFCFVTENMNLAAI